MATIKKTIKKAQAGIKATKDSTDYYSKQASNFGTAAARNMNRPATANRAFKNQKEALDNMFRQSDKGKPGYDKNGFPVKKKMKAGGIINKAQNGEVIKGSRKGLGVFKTEKQRTTSGGTVDPYKYKRTSIDTTGYSKGKSSYDLKTQEGEGDKTGSKSTRNTSKKILRKDVPSTLKSLDKAKAGAMIKRADGSMSKRGLWDNIRANKGSGKKPTAAMLKQEKKIKAKAKK
jgi:hypothetical protein